ncbi:MAG: hypothetical protein LH465_02695, partial [Sphingomonas bacterium]|nr:hypothetical protein [Sphingomonas bacterium]
MSATAALAHGRRLLDAEPGLAAEQARAILETDPDHAAALRLLGAALRRRGGPPAPRWGAPPAKAPPPPAP